MHEVTWEALREAWFKDRLFSGPSEKFDAEEAFFEFMQKNRRFPTPYDTPDPRFFSPVSDRMARRLDRWRGL